MGRWMAYPPLLALVLHGSQAAAQQPSQTSGVDPLPPAAENTFDRTKPETFRGRPKPTAFGEAALWAPRVLFFPLYVVTEFGLRVPIYAAAEWVDEHHVVPIVDHFFHPTPDISWFPVFSLDLGASASFGARVKWKNMGVLGHEMRLSAEAGGEDFWRVTGQDKWEFEPGKYIGVRGDLSSVPNRPFFGMGPRAPNYRVNFKQTRYDGFLFGGLKADNHVQLDVATGMRVEDNTPGWDPSIETAFDLKKIPGFDLLHLMMVTADLKVDSRQMIEENGGLRLLGNLTYARDTVVPERAFVSVSVDLEGALEVSSPDRVLAARVYTIQTLPLGKEPVPFSHQAMLGWQNHHGFLWGRFRGESAALGEIHYRYPIAYYVDAQWTASVGNVFGPRFKGFDVGDMTGSIGVGLRTRRIGESPIELTFALGTTRFNEALSFDAVRVFFGTVEGL